MQWLQKYTFPTEASFADPATANLNYQLVVRRLLSLGTTTATYYGTIHTQQCKLLADIVKTLGQRAVVGKVNMDRNSPADYVEDAAAGVSGAEEFVTYCQALGCPRVMPCVTPRFIPTCSLESMRSLADVAARHGVHLQTHISESADEVAFSKSLHPEFANDTEVYKSVGVLGPKSVLAHATFMGDDEYRALAAAGCGIAHCPLSNFFVSDWKLR